MDEEQIRQAAYEGKDEDDILGDMVKLTGEALAEVAESVAYEEQIRQAAYEGKDMDLFAAKEEMKDIIGGLQIDMNRAWDRMAEAMTVFEEAENRAQDKITNLESVIEQRREFLQESEYRNYSKLIDLARHFVNYLVQTPDKGQTDMRLRMVEKSRKKIQRLLDEIAPQTDGDS